MIIDAWVQHPTSRHMQDPIFESLRRWTKAPTPTVELPVAMTIAMMDQVKITKSLICAWVAPRNVMISNDEVAGFVGQAPERLIGVGSVDISKPMTAVREVRRCIQELGFKAIRILLSTNCRLMTRPENYFSVPTRAVYSRSDAGEG